MTKKAAVDDALGEKFTGAGVGALLLARRAGVDAVLGKMWSVGLIGESDARQGVFVTCGLQAGG